MDAAAQERFSHHVAAMSRSLTNFETWEHRKEAEEIAKEQGWTFDQALRAHRAGWPAADEEGIQIEDVETSLPASPAGGGKTDGATLPIVRLPRRGARGGAHGER